MENISSQAFISFSDLVNTIQLLQKSIFTGGIGHLWLHSTSVWRPCDEKKFVLRSTIWGFEVVIHNCIAWLVLGNLLESRHKLLIGGVFVSFLFFHNLFAINLEDHPLPIMLQLHVIEAGDTLISWDNAGWHLRIEAKLREATPGRSSRLQLDTKTRRCWRITQSFSWDLNVYMIWNIKWMSVNDITKTRDHGKLQQIL